MVMSQWKCTNVVYHFTMNRKVRTNNIGSSKDVFFEPEIFPAILLSKWKPTHITLFANGKGMITGVKDKKTAVDTLSQLIDHLSSSDDIH